MVSIVCFINQPQAELIQVGGGRPFKVDMAKALIWNVWLELVCDAKEENLHIHI